MVYLDLIVTSREQKSLERKSASLNFICGEENDEDRKLIDRQIDDRQADS